MIALNSPFTKILNIDFPLLLLGAVSQSYLSFGLPGCSLHFAPSKTELSTLTLCIFLVDNGKQQRAVTYSGLPLKIEQNLPSYLKVITASAKLVEVFSDPALESPLNLIVPHIAQIVLQPKTPNLFLLIS